MLVVRVAGDNNIVLRLRAELSSYRFRVIELPQAQRRAEELAQLAEERDVQAALRAKPDSMAVELWVRAGSRTSEELVSAGPGSDPEVLAVRVTEAMRARGLVLPPLTAATRPAPAIGAAAESGKRSADASAASEPDDSVAVPTPQPSVTTPVTTRSKAPEPPRPAAPAKAKEDRRATEQPPVSRESPATTEAKPTERAATTEAKPTERAATTEAKLTERAATTQTTPTERAATTETTPTERAETPKPEDASPTSTKLRDALLYAEAGATAVLSPGANRLGPGLDALVSLRFRPNPTSSISLVGLIPLLSTNLLRDGIAVEVRTFGIGGFADMHMPLGRVELSAGLGGLALLSSVLVTMSPDAAVVPDYPVKRLAALLGRVGASYALTGDLRVSGSLMAGLAVQPLRIGFPSSAGMAEPENTAAAWGQPLLLGTVSLELALPWNR